MNKYLIGVGMVVLATVGNSQSSEAVLCSGANTYADLQGFGSCDIGNKTFNNFGYANPSIGNPPAVPSSAVGVKSLGGPMFWGFEFHLPLSAGSNQVNDILIDYTVTCNALSAQSNCISSAELVMVGGALGTGNAIVSETICLGGPIAGCLAQNIIGLNVGFPFPLADSRSVGDGKLPAWLSPVHTLSLIKDIQVFGGSDGFATISGIINTVNDVNDVNGIPEPATLTLFGVGLAGLAALRRRRKAKA